MKILPIYTYGFEILRRKARRIHRIDDKLIELISNMFYTMHRAHGIGLAAPQVGLDITMTVIDISKAEENKKIKHAPLTLINPVVKDFHGEILMEEGCLSIPYLRSEISRPETVFVEFHDINMNKQNIELTGLISRVAQHEIDHLNGILFTDHLKKDQKKLIKDELQKIRKGEIETDYLLAELPKKKTKSRT